MSEEKIYIKNMVCNRCIMVVRSELKKLGIEPISIELGEVTLSKALDSSQKEELNGVLESLGFALIDDKKARLIEQVKTLIVELVHYNNNDLKVNLSDYISEKVLHDYNYVSNLFSEVEGTTIEKYFIAQKVEKVKELLVYDELTLNEIAFKLNYSSVAHLSTQFKKVTGLTPTHFKQIKTNKRKPLDKV
ncbi:MAG: AraC family transcriptional regulator [Prevotella sp.]|nr:AraC family transcriptional regulator [Prevotella sp.]